jgi:DNA-binding response OmpR family regulator
VLQTPPERVWSGRVRYNATGCQTQRLGGPRVAFDRFVFDRSSLELRYAGEFVTRDELKRAIWGDETFADFSRILNDCVNQTRAALAADAPGGEDYGHVAFAIRVPRDLKVT